MSGKKESLRPWITRSEILVIVLLSLACLLWLYASRRSSSGQSAEIYVDGELVQTVSLTENQIFSPDGCPQVVLEISDGRIRFQSSSCPDKICVQTGWLSHEGEYAICLPLRVMVRIPAKAGSPDAVTGSVQERSLS